MIERKVGANFRICQKPRSRSSLGKQADPVYQYFHRIEFIGKLAKLLKNIPAVSLNGVGTKINRYINMRGRTPSRFWEHVQGLSVWRSPSACPSPHRRTISCDNRQCHAIPGQEAGVNLFSDDTTI